MKMNDALIRVTSMTLSLSQIRITTHMTRIRHIMHPFKDQNYDNGSETPLPFEDWDGFNFNLLSPVAAWGVVFLVRAIFSSLARTAYTWRYINQRQHAFAINVFEKGSYFWSRTYFLLRSELLCIRFADQSYNDDIIITSDQNYNANDTDQTYNASIQRSELR